MRATIENTLSSSLGESASEIRASYKKTVLVKQYETEVIELETVLKVEQPVSNAERTLLSAILQVQLEYTAYCQLLAKGLVTQTEFTNRKSELEEGLNALKDKAEQILGRSMDSYFTLNMN